MPRLTGERVRKYQENTFLLGTEQLFPKKSMCWDVGSFWQNSLELIAIDRQELHCLETDCDTWILYLVNKNYIATVLPITTKLSLTFVMIIMPPVTYDALTLCQPRALQP